MSRVRFLLAVATVATGGALLVPSLASAHANSVTCVDQATSTWRITNDHPLSETFTSTEGPSGSVAGGAGQFTDVVYNGDSLTVTGTWTDGFVGSTTGSGDCSPEVQPTTTILEPTTTTGAPTSTTIAPTTTSAPTTTEQSTSTSTVVESSTTSTQPILTTTSSLPATTSSQLGTTTTSVPSTTLPPPSSAPTTPPPTSTPSGTPTSTPRLCTAGPSTPEPSLPGTPSAPPCGQLPATGNPDLSILTGIAAATIIAGAFMLTKTRR